MNILILGTGYIGSILVDYLSKDLRNKIEIITRKSLSQYSRNIIVYNSKHLTEENCKEIFQKAKIIINTIGTTAEFSKEFNNEAFNINIYPINLICKYASANTIVIYLSTVWVYGDILNGHINESSSTLGKSNYALSRIHAENLLLSVPKIKAYILRLSIVFGWPKNHHSNCWNLSINSFVKSAVEKSLIKLNTTGTQLRDNISTYTVCESIKFIIDNAYLVDPGVYNISSSNSMRIIDIAKLIKNRIFKTLRKKEIKINIGTIHPEKNLDLNISNEKFKKLGFKFNENMISTIDEMIFRLNNLK